jgi:hypothetical protein
MAEVTVEEIAQRLAMHADRMRNDFLAAFHEGDSREKMHALAESWADFLRDEAYTGFTKPIIVE